MSSDPYFVSISGGRVALAESMRREDIFLVLNLVKIIRGIISGRKGNNYKEKGKTPSAGKQK